MDAEIFDPGPFAQGLHPVDSVLKRLPGFRVGKDPLAAPLLLLQEEQAVKVITISEHS